MMKFAYFNPTVMAIEDVPADTYISLKSIVDRAHENPALNDEGDPSISIRGGQQIQLVPNEFGLDTKDLKEFVESSCREYIANIMRTNGRHDLDLYEPVLTSAWTIKQSEGDYQSLHSHEAHISGNIYIDVPDFDADSKASDGNIEFRLPVIRNPAHLIFTDQWRFQPQVMKMIIFPSYLPHTVYPWKGEGNRTILAWDARLISKEG
jgi:hypothetical protein